MNWRWLWFDYVDPSLGLSAAERKSVRRLASQLGHDPAYKSFRASAWMVMAFAPVPAVCIFGLLFLKGSLLRGRNVWVDGFLSLSTLLLGSICCYLFVAWLGRTTWRPFILLALRETGYPVCVRCGYSMQGLDQQTLKCPECGADRDGHVAVD